MKRIPAAAALPLTILAAGLARLAPGAARAATPTTYTTQPIVKLGDHVADVNIESDSDGGDLEMGSLNDSGQIAFVTENAAGGEMLLQYTNGQFIPIVVGGRDAPGGMWAPGSGIPTSPVSMNQRGDIAFAGHATIGGTTGPGTFRWDYASQKVSLVAFQGGQAVNNLTFMNGSNFTPVINNSGEIAFAADVNNAAGQARSGAFFLGRDGQIQAVALPDQVLPDGTNVQNAYSYDVNDAGVVAFVTMQQGEQWPDRAYVWDKGTITPVAHADDQIPLVGTIGPIVHVWVNNHNQNALVWLGLSDSSQNRGLYLFADGGLTRLVEPGQAMPDGGTLLTVGAVSGANQAGQRAFIGKLQDGTRSAYLLNADGTLSSILTTGAPTALGKITNIGNPSGGIALNDQGQVALNVAIDGVTTMVVLTPAAP